MAKDKPIMALDLGSTRVAALLFARRGDEFTVEGSGIAVGDNVGLKGGVVVNMQAVVEAVAKAGEQAERTAGMTAETALVALPTPMCHSRIVKRSVDIQDWVRAEDMSRLTATTPQDGAVISQNALSYSLEGPQGDKSSGRELSRLSTARRPENPLEMSGSRLSARLHRVVVEPSTHTNLMKILRLCRFCDRIHLLPAVVAAADAVLDEEERQKPVLLVEMGGGTTSMAMFDERGLLHVDYVPVGGDHITKDIAYAFKATKAAAEKLKLDPTADQITTMEGKAVSVRELGRITGPRLEEIFELLLRKVEALAGDKTYGFFGDYHVVLSGGASRSENAKAIASRIFNRCVRLSKPTYRAGLPQSVHGPGFASLLGLATSARTVSALNRPQGGWLNRLGLWLKECFEDETELCK